MKSWLEKGDLEMYLTHNEEKPTVAERFIRSLKNKFYKYMASISKNKYIDKMGYMIKKKSYKRVTKNKKEFRIEKVIKKKGNKRYVKWNDYDNSSNSWIDKNDIVIQNELPSRPSTYRKIEVELDLSNYAAKSDLKKQQALIHRNWLNKMI